jgi:hypothetical protein
MNFIAPILTKISSVLLLFSTTVLSSEISTVRMLYVETLDWRKDWTVTLNKDERLIAGQIFGNIKCRKIEKKDDDVLVTRGHFYMIEEMSEGQWRYKFGFYGDGSLWEGHYFPKKIDKTMRERLRKLIERVNPHRENE